MEICTQCGEPNDKLELWGDSRLCPKCVKRYLDEWPDKPPADFSDLMIDEPRFMGGATYKPATGKTAFRGTCFDYARTINHEFLHYILHNFVDIRCCYQYDHTSQTIDSYHSFE